MKASLSEPHQKTYDAVFRIPTPRDIQWNDVWAMLGAVGDSAAEDQHGNLTVKLNGRTLALRRPRGKDLADMKELLQIRNFIERSG